MSAQTVAEVPVLRALPIPVAEPRPALRVVAREAPVAVLPGTDQGTLTLHPEPGRHPEPGGDGDPGRRRSGVEPVRRGAGPGTAGLRSVERPLPPPLHWARQFVQAALEVAAGRRPAHQLVRWAGEDVFSTLARRASLAGRVDHGATGASNRAARATATAVAVRSVRICQVAADAVEASAVVTDRGRIRAVALRMEGTDGRWRVTALEIG
jgi:hypothetical protein